MCVFSKPTERFELSHSSLQERRSGQPELRRHASLWRDLNSRLRPYEGRTLTSLSYIGTKTKIVEFLSATCNTQNLCCVHRRPLNVLSCRGRRACRKTDATLTRKRTCSAGQRQHTHSYVPTVYKSFENQSQIQTSMV